jgi:hypothetical protein
MISPARCRLCLRRAKRFANRELSLFCSDTTEKNNRYVKEKSYLWTSNYRLLQIITDGKVKRFDYGGWGNLSKTIFEDGSVVYRNHDSSSSPTAKSGTLKQIVRSGIRVSTKTARRNCIITGSGIILRRRGCI